MTESRTLGKIRHTFPDDVTIEGPITVLVDYALRNKFTLPRNLLKEIPAGYHLSEDGLEKISDMHTYHIINSMTKVARMYFEEIKPKRNELDLDKYLKDFQSLVTNTNVESYFKELVSRIHKK